MAALRRGLVGFLVFFLILEFITRLELVNPRWLPPASVVLSRVVFLLFDSTFLVHVAATMRAWAIGLGTSIAVAIPLGIVLGSSRVVYSGSRIVVEFLRPIPSVALIPLAILLFGQGTQMKVSLAVYSALWPILFNTIYAIHQVDPVAKDTGRSFGFGRLWILRKISLPSSMPFIYTGIRVASAIALIVTISAEMLAGGSRGIGTWMLIMGEGAVRADLVYAGVVVAGLLGWIINQVLVQGERRFLGWQPALRKVDA